MHAAMHIGSLGNYTDSYFLWYWMSVVNGLAEICKVYDFFSSKKNLCFWDIMWYCDEL